MVRAAVGWRCCNGGEEERRAAARIFPPAWLTAGSCDASAGGDAIGCRKAEEREESVEDNSNKRGERVEAPPKRAESGASEQKCSSSARRSKLLKLAQSN